MVTNRKQESGQKDKRIDIIQNFFIKPGASTLTSNRKKGIYLCHVGLVSGPADETCVENTLTNAKYLSFVKSD